jgi:23S rRNA (pseudouridine1915-N3)-methyltransferase
VAASGALRVTVAAVGRDRASSTRDLFEDYCRRSSWPIRLVEIAPRSRLPTERRQAHEAERLLAAVPDQAVAVALDEHGRQLDSLAFARQLGRWRDQGASELAFLIGGPDGLATSVLERAAAVIALGAMTWPHRLVRVMLAEQLYRAGTILSGHPYHRAGLED